MNKAQLQRKQKKEVPEPSRTLSIKLPLSLYEALRTEAKGRLRSTNAQAQIIIARHLGVEKYKDND